MSQYVNPEKVKECVLAKSEAGEILQFTEQCASFGTKFGHAEFWRIIRDEALKHAPLASLSSIKPPMEPMTRGEAVAFGKQEMPFGKYAGRLIEDVPLTYLDWLLGEEQEFKRNMRRYLASEDVGRRLGEELDDGSIDAFNAL